jgi:ferrochelatase
MIQKEFENVNDDGEVHLVFSAHAVPLKHAGERGCPYLKEVELAAELICDEMEWSYPMHIAHQNRGRWGEWSGPSIDTTLNTLLIQGVRSCLVVPISFIFENVETLIDLDENVIPRLKGLGMTGLKRVQMLGNSKEVINILAELVQNSVRMVSDTNVRQKCPTLVSDTSA